MPYIPDKDSPGTPFPKRRSTKFNISIISTDNSMDADQTLTEGIPPATQRPEKDFTSDSDGETDTNWPQKLQNPIDSDSDDDEKHRRMLNRMLGDHEESKWTDTISDENDTFRGDDPYDPAEEEMFDNLGAAIEKDWINYYSRMEEMTDRTKAITSAIVTDNPNNTNPAECEDAITGAETLTDTLKKDIQTLEKEIPGFPEESPIDFDKQIMSHLLDIDIKKEIKDSPDQSFEDCYTSDGLTNYETLSPLEKEAFQLADKLQIVLSQLPCHCSSGQLEVCNDCYTKNYIDSSCKLTPIAYLRMHCFGKSGHTAQRCLLCLGPKDDF